MVQILSVTKNSPADKAGVRAGDILLTVNGETVCDVLDYRFYAVDANSTVTVSRDGQLCATARMRSWAWSLVRI